jgi:nucleoside phosphorylase
MSCPKYYTRDYTVGWICALHTEYVAAQSFLDKEHEHGRLEGRSANDNNDYTLGEIGGHKVVITVLPDGECSTSSAASVAKDMLHTFPNIRIGLSVGTGSGAPSQNHDIRLGDVVVSASRDGNDGVSQYNFDETVEGLSFCPTGFLNQPPAILRTAVSGLKVIYVRKGHQFEEAIGNILEKNKRMRRKYGRPNPDSDRLYRSKVLHPLHDEASCARSCGNDRSKLIIRPERAEDEDSPAIHYGLIAWSDQVMKNALIRDKLAVERDILCFEMGGAGLNHFPCLVIRGICDYADSHKNNEWQGYAAMVAAAYAKDLLCRIIPQQLETQKAIGDIISSG